MRGVTGVIVQPHQILHLPRKIVLMIDPCHIWNVIYKARSNRCHCPTSPNTANATKDDSHDWSLSHIETSFTMRRATGVIDQPHQILRLPRKMTVQNVREISRKQMKRHLQCAADPRPFRESSEHDPTMNPSVRNPPRNRGYFSRSSPAFCIEKYNISRSGYHSKFHEILHLPRKVTVQLHQILRLPRKVTLELHQILHLPRKVTLELHQILRLPQKVTLKLHQILHLPRKVTLIIDPCHIWNAIYNARSKRCHCPTSPNSAPATKNDRPKCDRWNVIYNARPIQDRSENDPSMNPSVRNPPRSILYWKIQHFALRLSFQISRNTAPATKSDT